MLALESVADPTWIASILQESVRGGRIARELDLNTGEIRLRPAQGNEAFRLEGELLTAVYGHRYRLLIVGGGDLSAFLAQIAIKLDYDVTICDPRKEYTESLQIEGATIVSTMPDDTVIEMKPDGHTAIVTVSHDPKLDDLALIEALVSDAFYVGAIGSRRNNEKRRERLAMFDVSPRDLERLRGPVGIHIGSKTPFEIAVPIAAQLTAVKNGVGLPDSYSIAASKGASGSDICPVLPD